MIKVINLLILIVSANLSVFLGSNLQAKALQHERDWMFKVYLDDTPIGYHRFQVKQTDNQQYVISSANSMLNYCFYLFTNTSIKTQKPGTINA